MSSGDTRVSVDSRSLTIIPVNPGRKSHPKHIQESATYFIQAVGGGPIKIGRAKNVRDRLSALQTSHHERLRVLAVIEKNCEAELHRRFAADRVAGEWFSPSYALLEFLRTELNVYAYEAKSIPYFARNSVQRIASAFVKFSGGRVIRPGDPMAEKDVGLDIIARMERRFAGDDEKKLDRLRLKHRKWCECSWCGVSYGWAFLPEDGLKGATFRRDGLLTLIIRAPAELGEMIRVLDLLIHSFSGFDRAGITSQAIFVNQDGFAYLRTCRLWRSAGGRRGDLRQQIVERYALLLREALNTPGCSIYDVDISDLISSPSAAAGACETHPLEQQNPRNLH